MTQRESWPEPPPVEPGAPSKVDAVLPGIGSLITASSAADWENHNPLMSGPPVLEPGKSARGIADLRRCFLRVVGR
jgi:hypothetical protein